MIKIGDKGDKVRKWQTFLMNEGFDVAVDGYFGLATKQITKQFQASKGIISDGIVGDSTIAFMKPAHLKTNSIPNIWPKQDYNSMVDYYGPVGENQTSLQLPYKLKLAWDLNVTISKLTCNEKIASSLYTIFEKTLDAYGQKDVNALKLNVFGGCLNVRKMRGSSSSWSIHSWGAAVDLDPDRNTLRMSDKQATFARLEYADFWRIVESEGWISLGRTRNYDWMHFQAAIL